MIMLKKMQQWISFCLWRKFCPDRGSIKKIVKSVTLVRRCRFCFRHPAWIHKTAPRNKCFLHCKHFLLQPRTDHTQFPCFSHVYFVHFSWIMTEKNATGYQSNVTRPVLIGLVTWWTVSVLINFNNNNNVAQVTSKTNLKIKVTMNWNRFNNSI